MVKELLNKGEENAITTEELMKRCGIGSMRQLRLQIAKERSEGALICSRTTGGGGYYLPGSRMEVELYIKSMSNRANNTYKAIMPAFECLKQIEGQLDMDDIQVNEVI